MSSGAVYAKNLTAEMSSRFIKWPYYFYASPASSSMVAMIGTAKPYYVIMFGTERSDS